MTKFAWLTAFILTIASPAWPCDVIRKEPATPQRLVAGAEVIVHARVIGHSMDGVTDADNFPASLGRVIFNVLRVLRGNVRGSELRIIGALSESDDFNDGEVPYASIRSGGRGGLCYAYEYRAGGEYVLLLRADAHGTHDPYWEPLQPTNEQITGASDPWLTWIEEAVKRGR